jgi:6,7-dimethyl-8-ribityllumazine synthase
VRISRIGRSTGRFKSVRDGLSTKGLRFGIIVSQFNDFVTHKLHDGALNCLKAHGITSSQVESFSCPGSFELPQVANHLAATGRYDALICLGCVIRGETPHFKYVAGEAAHGIEQVALETGVPITFGVLTTDTPKQALERAGGKMGNKGWDAALSAIEVATLFRNIRERNKKKRGRH